MPSAFSTDFNACKLHIPHKDWAEDAQERQNYEAIERWSLQLPRCYQQFGQGGAITVHRAVYGHSRGCYGPPVVPGPTPFYTYYNNTPGDGGNYWWDWGNSALTADAINIGGCFGTDEFGSVGRNGYLPVMPVSKSGLLSWHGYYTVSGTGPWDILFDDYVGVSQLEHETNTQDPIVAFGGSYYVTAGSELTFMMRQNTGTARAMDIRVMLTLLEF